MPDTRPPRPVALWRRLVIAAATSLPPLGFLLAVLLADRPEPIVLGLPFFPFWIMVCVALTGTCLILISRLDPRNSAPDRPRPGSAGPDSAEDVEPC